MNVDHIKPRRLFPHLALDLRNLQVLCEDCNHGSANWSMTDWRSAAKSVEPPPDFDPATEFLKRIREYG